MEKINHLLFVYPHQMYPVAGGGVVRSLQVLRFLITNRWQVDLLTTKVNRKGLRELLGSDCRVLFAEELERNEPTSLSERRLRHKLDNLRNTSVYYRNYDPNVIDSARALLQRNEYTHVLTNYLWTADILKGIPSSIVKIIDTHDLQFMRSKQFKRFGQVANGYECSKHFEIQKYDMADRVLCINKEEMDILSNHIEEKKLIYVPFIPEKKNCEKKTPEKVVIFVGNKYMPNEVGIRRFIEESWNIVLAHIPTAKLVIVGKIGEVLEDYNGRSDIEIVGRVESLSLFYSRASVAIVPVTLGTGLKIKAIEALSYCKPVVISELSSRGIDYFGDYPDQCARSFKDFGLKVSAILSSSGIRRALEARVRKYVMDGVSSSKYYRRFLSSIS